MWKQNIPITKCYPPVSIEPRPLMNLWFQVRHSPFYTNWAFACKTETLVSLYNHALLILTKFRNQVVHEQSDGLGIRGSLGVWIKYSLEIIFCYWNILFSRTKAPDANVGIIANFIYYGKTRMVSQERTGLEDLLCGKILLSSTFHLLPQGERRLCLIKTEPRPRYRMSLCQFWKFVSVAHIIKGICNNGLLPWWSRTFIEFSELSESD